MDSEDDLEVFRKRYGYCGNNFDLLLTWVNYGEESSEVRRKLQKIIIKQSYSVQEDLERYQAFRNDKKWGNFYDPNARRHSRWLYRSVANKKEFKNSGNLDFFSSNKNEKFFEIAHKFAQNP